MKKIVLEVHIPGFSKFTNLGLSAAGAVDDAMNVIEEFLENDLDDRQIGARRRKQSLRHRQRRAGKNVAEAMRAAICELLLSELRRICFGVATVAGMKEIVNGACEAVRTEAGIFFRLPMCPTTRAYADDVIAGRHLARIDNSVERKLEVHDIADVVRAKVVGDVCAFTAANTYFDAKPRHGLAELIEMIDECCNHFIGVAAKQKRVDTDDLTDEDLCVRSDTADVVEIHDGGVDRRLCREPNIFGKEVHEATKGRDASGGVSVEILAKFFRLPSIRKDGSKGSWKEAFVQLADGAMDACFLGGYAARGV